MARGLNISDEDIEKLCGKMFEVAMDHAGNDEQRALIRPVTKSQLIKWHILIPRGNRVLATNAYALLSGSELFSVETKCAVFKGKNRDIFIDRHKFGGPIYEQVEAAFKYVLSKINLSSRINGLYREDKYEIPPSAIRELIVNAIVHRNYIDENSSAVSVALYDDRLEITSPGRLPYGVTVEKMLEGYSECRNKALAPAFAYMHLIEDWGSGIPRIMANVRAAGLKDIKFEAWPNAVRAIIYRKVVTNPEEVVTNPEEVVTNPNFSDKLTDLEKKLVSVRKDYREKILKVYAMLLEDPKQTVRGIKGKLGFSQGTVSSAILKLKKIGVLERKGYTWQVK